MSKYWVENISPKVMKTGDHVYESLRHIISHEWQGRNLPETSFLQKIREMMEKYAGGLPDFDTGYQYVEKNQSYILKHDLGQAPSRLSFFFSDVQEPVYKKDKIYIATPSQDDMGTTNRGFWVEISDKNELKISTAVDFVWKAYAEGYLRVLLWR